MVSEHAKLEKQIQSLESQLKTYPSGKLIVTRNDNRYKWYHSDGHHNTYIPKRKMDYATQLAAKKLSIIKA